MHSIPFRSRSKRSILAVLLLAAGCSGGAQEGGPAAGGPGGRGGGPPMAVPVEMITLAEKPTEQSAEFVATVKARRSTTIQPQVEGFLTRINVKSGDRVAPGRVLFEVDNSTQQSAVASLESVRAARQADAAYAKQQADRAKTLLDVGAMSQQEYEQALTQQKTADAQLNAVEQQIKQQRTELGYYRVTAPTAGVVGDVPVRLGERVTRQTELTTIEDNSGLELYVNVPVQEAPKLKVGLPVRLADESGQVVATEKISFISPSVDDTTQTVLVKTAIAGRGAFRADQFVRAEIVFGNQPRLTIPVTAVNRINGQYFAFVAQPGDGGALVARQVAVTVGEVIGNEYLVRSGLKAGDRLIVSGIQKIGDGAPVAQAGPPPPGAAPAAGSGREGGK
jgi:RND family efflux transporter MFP subunit